MVSFQIPYSVTHVIFHVPPCCRVAIFPFSYKFIKYVPEKDPRMFTAFLAEQDTHAVMVAWRKLLQLKILIFISSFS